MDTYTIASLAKELGITPKEIKTILDLPMSSAGITELGDEQVNDVRAFSNDTEPTDGFEAVSIETLAPTPIPEPEPEPKEESDVVMFFWARNADYQFFVPTPGVDTPNLFYKTANSVLSLSKKSAADVQAIEILDRHKDNEKNGGRGFKRVSSLSIDKSDVGQTIDELMALDNKVLARMSGLGMEAERMTKGNLIAAVLETQK